MRIATKNNKTYLYIKISEIIGIAKSIKATFQSLKNMIDSYKNKDLSVSASATKDMLKQYAIQYGTSAIKSLVDPAIALLQADERYQKIYKVYMTVKPLVQMAARSSGATFSPGNIAEIAKIAMGIAIDTLKQLALSAFYTVKQMVLNYELEVPIGSVKSTASIVADEKTVSDTSDVTLALENTESFESDDSEEEGTTTFADSLTVGEAEESVAENSTGTLYIEGSQEDEGIAYSTDGENWISSNITTGSWKVINVSDTLWMAASILTNASTQGYGVKYSEDGMSWEDITLDTTYSYTETTSETSTREYSSEDTIGTETTDTSDIDPITEDYYTITGTKEVTTKITNIIDETTTELTIETTKNLTRTLTLDFTTVSNTDIYYIEDKNIIIDITNKYGKFISNTNLGKEFSKTIEVGIPEGIINSSYTKISELS